MRARRPIVATFGLVLALAAAASPPAKTHAFDYVENGGFEEGTTSWAAPPSATFEAVVDASAIEGTRVGRITLGDSWFSIRQTSRAGMPSGTYTLRASVRTTSPATQVYVQTISSNPPVEGAKTYANILPGAWSAVVASIRSPGFGDLTLIIGGQGQPGDVVYVDDVRFEGGPPATMTPTRTPIPPPATSTPVVPVGPVPTTTRTPRPPPPPSIRATETIAPTGADKTDIIPSLRNGDFEQADGAGVPSFWSHYGGSITLGDRPPHGGAHAARLDSTTDSTKWIYQTLSVDPRAAYAFDAWILDEDSNVSSALLRVSWYAGADGNGTAIASDDSVARLDSSSGGYRYLTTAAITAPDTAHTARVRVLLAPASSARATIYVDDAVWRTATDADFAAARYAAASRPAGSKASSRARSSSGATRGETASDFHVAGGAGARTGIVINEVLYDPDGDGRNADGEWVELYNPSDDRVDFSGWTIADNRGSDVLPELTVGPGGFAILAASDRFVSTYPDYDGPLAVLGGRIGNSLGNDGDHLVLKDASGAIIDAVGWGNDVTIFEPAIIDVPSGHSIERSPAGVDTDSADDFVDNVSPSPGSGLDISIETGGGAAGPSLNDSLAPSHSAVPSALTWALPSVAAVALAAIAGWRILPIIRRRFTGTA